MANFISIPVTSATAYAAGQRLIGLNTVLGVFATGAATVVIYTNLKTFTLTTSTAGAVTVVNAINATIEAAPGAPVVMVDLPHGTTINSVAVS